MHFSSLCEIISAAHLSNYVKAPIEDRGGLMLVAPPGHLKTTAAEVLQEFSNTIVISDLTLKSITQMREDMLAGHILTLIASDYSKIHKRHASIATNIEGVIMALVGEGFRKSAFADQRIQAIPARVVVVGCMTPKFAEDKQGDWLDNGFYRRFIWSRYRLDDPEFLEDALKKWKKAEIDGDFSARIPGNRFIEYTLTESEVNKIAHSLRHMLDRKIALVLSQRILCALKWKFKRDPDLPMKIWNDFAESLTDDGAILYAKPKR